MESNAGINGVKLHWFLFFVCNDHPALKVGVLHSQSRALPQPTQEALDLGRAHLAQVAQTVKANERTNPINILLFGSIAIMLIPNAFANLTKQANGL